MVKSTALRYVLHYFLILVVSLLLILGLLTGTAYYIAVSNQERVPELVSKVCREQLGAEADFSSYRFRYLKNFPFLSLTLEDVSLRGPDFEQHGRELLRVKKMNVVFRPWKMLRRDFEVRSVTVDSARVQLFRSKKGDYNASFLSPAPDSAGARVDSAAFSSIFSIKKATLNGFFFDFTDSLRNKQFRFVIRQSELGLQQQGDKGLLHMQGSWFFHRLLFKAENGPYFRDTEAEASLTVEFDRNDPIIKLLPSRLIVGQDSLQLNGGLRLQDTGYIRLEVASPGIFLENAYPLLADNLQRALKNYSLSQPMPVRVHIEGNLIPGQQQPLEVNFSAENTTLATKGLEFSAVNMVGRYTNDCDSIRPITPHTDCLDIQLLSSKLFDTIPLQASYHAEGLLDPITSFNGIAEAPLERINSFLPAGQFAFRGGRGELAFSYTGKPEDLKDPKVKSPEMKLEGRLKIRNATLEYLPKGLMLQQAYANIHFDENNLVLDGLRLQLDEAPYELKGRINGFIPTLFDKESPLGASIWASTPMLDFGVFFSKRKNKEGQATTPGEPSVRNEVAQRIKDISNRLPVELEVEAGEVRYQKLYAREVLFRGKLSQYCAGSPGSCLSIESLSGKIFGDIPVHALITVDNWEDPRLNMEVRLNSPLRAFSDRVPRDKIRLRGGRLAVKLNYQGRLDDYSSLSTAAINASLKGSARLSDASFDYLPRGYKARQVNGRFHFDENDLFVDSLDLCLNDNTIEAQGKIEGLIPFAFEPGHKIQAQLNVFSPTLDLNHFPLVGKKESRKKNSQPPAGNIAARVQAAIQKIEGKLKVKADTLHYRDITLSKVDFDSRFRDDCPGQHPNGCVVFDSLSATLFGDTPFRAQLMVNNLADPFLVADAEVDMPMENLNRMFPPGQFRFEGGIAKVQFHYEGQPHKHFDVKEAILKADLDGEAQIFGATIDYKPRGYRLENMNASLQFDENDLSIRRMALLLNQNPIQASGAIHDFLPFLFLPERELRTTLALHSPKFDLGNFKAPKNFLQEDPGQALDTTAVTRLVYAGLENIRANFRISLDTVTYQNFSALQAVGEIAMAPGRASFENTRMQLADGTFHLSGQITGLENNQPSIDIEARFDSANIQKVFKAFDDFGQEELTQENIEGKLSADITFQGQANSNYEILPSSLRGQIGLRIENGALINLAALDSIRSFVLRNRDLSQVEFATLENTFELKGQDLFINQFFVASSVLTFGVEGRYCLGDGNHTDMLFEVPIANLFRREVDKPALETLHERGPGLSVLLRATEEEGAFNFKLLLSRKQWERK